MRAQRPGGYALIELIVVFGLLAVVFTVVAVTLQGLHRAGQKLQVDLERERSVMRLAARLRRDAHDAELAVVAPAKDAAPEALDLALANQVTVRYAIGPSGIDRVHKQGDAPPHRETFPLPSLAEAKWVVDASAGQPLVSLTLSLAPDRRHVAPGLMVVHRIEAVTRLYGRE